MFAPRGYTAVPQEPVDEEDEDQLTTSYEQRKNTRSKNADGMAARSPTENKDGEREQRVKRNVRFESKSLDEKQEPMSKVRRLCFVVSLMTCTLTIFVFAFTVPCKGPQCRFTMMPETTVNNEKKTHGNWSVDFPGHTSLAGITFHEKSPGKNGEIIVSYNGSWPNHGSSRKRESLPGSRESGLLSLKEENGELIWLFNASNVLKLIGCKTEEEGLERCLIENSPGDLLLINPGENKIVWSARILIGSILPSIIMSIGDCDGDGINDILLSYNYFNKSQVEHSRESVHVVRSVPGKIQLLSGRTGNALGKPLNLPQNHLIKRISLQSTSHTTDILFLLSVGAQGHLQVISVKKLYEHALKAKSGAPTDLFSNSTVKLSHVVSVSHTPVLKDLNQDLVEDVVLVTMTGNRHSLTAVDGGKLKKMWRISFGARKITSQPVIGHFNGDDIPDILVVLQDPVFTVHDQSLVQILDGKNGDILWSRKLTLVKNTSPLSASIGGKTDAFFMWIKTEKVRKYTKSFAVQEAEGRHLPRKFSATRHHDIEGNHTRNLTAVDTTATKVRHRRSKLLRHRRNELSHSEQSPQEKAKSISEMEEELDSLAAEVDDRYSKPRKHVKSTQMESPKSRGALEFVKNVLKRVSSALTVNRADSLMKGKPRGMTNKNSNKFSESSSTKVGGMKDTIPSSDKQGWKEQSKEITSTFNKSHATAKQARNKLEEIVMNKKSPVIDDKKNVFSGEITSTLSENLTNYDLSFTSNSALRSANQTNASEISKKPQKYTLTTRSMTEAQSSKNYKYIPPSASGKMSQDFKHNVQNSSAKKVTSFQRSGILLRNEFEGEGSTESITRDNEGGKKTKDDLGRKSGVKIEVRSDIADNSVSNLNLEKKNKSSLVDKKSFKLYAENKNGTISVSDQKDKTLAVDGHVSDRNKPDNKPTTVRDDSRNTSHRGENVFKPFNRSDGNPIALRGEVIGTDITSRLNEPSKSRTVSDKDTANDSRAFSVKSITDRDSSSKEVDQNNVEESTTPMYTYDEDSAILCLGQNTSSVNHELATQPTVTRQGEDKEVVTDHVEDKGVLTDHVEVKKTPTHHQDEDKGVITDHVEVKGTPRHHQDEDKGVLTDHVEVKGTPAHHQDEDKGVLIDHVEVKGTPTHHQDEDTGVLTDQDVDKETLTHQVEDKGTPAHQVEDKEALTDHVEDKGVLTGDVKDKGASTRQSEQKSGGLKFRVADKRVLTQAINKGVLTYQDRGKGVLTHRIENKGVLTHQVGNKGVLAHQVGNKGVLTPQVGSKSVPTHQVGRKGVLANQVGNTSVRTHQFWNKAVLTHRVEDKDAVTHQAGSKGVPAHQVQDNGGLTHQGRGKSVLTHQVEDNGEPTQQGRDKGVNQPHDIRTTPNLQGESSKNSEAANKDHGREKVLVNSRIVHIKVQNTIGLVKSNETFNINSTHEVTARKPHNGNSTLNDHITQKFQTFTRVKQGVQPILPNEELHHDKRQDTQCTDSRSLALIAVFPNSPRNSFSVVSRENSLRNETQDPCNVYQPFINSNPIIRDVDRDGFLEIIYVVNFGKKEQEERTMQIKRFSVRSNWRG